MAKQGWEEGAGLRSFSQPDGHGPSPTVLESGSLSSSGEKNVIEHSENHAR